MKFPHITSMAQVKYVMITVLEEPPDSPVKTETLSMNRRSSVG